MFFGHQSGSETVEVAVSPTFRGPTTRLCPSVPLLDLDRPRDESVSETVGDYFVGKGQPTKGVYICARQ